ncbi:MAG: proteasome assembly chaperone family protein [Candidatus Thermoplasmatota archaeon]|jgi:uncharacterized protein (TIGR00162 family)|nr:proteasome assembly chaperone family protein [Candidatus Thermoplasmatota archaeon]
MEKIQIKKYMEIGKENKPILICGLPGIGNIGRLAADYIIDKFNMEKVCDIYSTYLPAQVFVSSESVVSLPKNSLYFKKLSKTRSILIFTGDFQGTTTEGQYEISETVLKLATSMGVKEVFTLGGYGVGKILESPRIIGAVSDLKMKKKLEAKGIIFSENEPGGGIIGSAGLILGMAGEFFGMDAACLMGETPGFFTDPKGSIELIKALSKIIKFSIKLEDLEERARSIEQITDKMHMEGQGKEQKEDLGYFV